MVVSMLMSSRIHVAYEARNIFEAQAEYCGMRTSRLRSSHSLVSSSSMNMSVARDSEMSALA